MNRHNNSPGRFKDSVSLKINDLFIYRINQIAVEKLGGQGGADINLI